MPQTLDPKELEVIAAVRANARSVIGLKSDWDDLLDLAHEKKIILLGEATHGTHEFYQARSLITQRLIEELDFSAVVIEADWPNAIAANRFLHADHSSDSEAIRALDSFRHFPMWMWRNSVFFETLRWLWVHNRKESTRHRVSLFGLDLYSLYHSVSEVIHYLEKYDPGSAAQARALYSCFENSVDDPVLYGREVRVGTQQSCEDAALEVLVRSFTERESSLEDIDELFFARQNAELVKSAESYYRNLFRPLVNTWNVRDRHMADTVDRIINHLREQGRPERVVVWAHNSHIGDDRATEMGNRGQFNIGQLLRERHPDETFHLGFTTHSGTVTAASEWDSPPELKRVLPALPGSIEALFHRAAQNNFFLNLQEPQVQRALSEPYLERAIGVIYSPETERASHYFHARISSQFDAVVHFDSSRELEPLDRRNQVENEPPSPIQF